MEDLLELIISAAIFIFLICLGFFAGTRSERKHLRSLAEREARIAGMLVTQLKSFPKAVVGPNPPSFFVGEVVIASDYFKNFLSGFRKFFGGEMRSYQRLLDRARREATLRLVEQAQSQGYNAVCNIRFSASDISGAAKAARAMPMATIMASGTAYYAARE
jgi:uncharacterized protein YbjQ (UPF0145 family)